MRAAVRSEAPGSGLEGTGGQEHVPAEGAHTPRVMQNGARGNQRGNAGPRGAGSTSPPRSHRQGEDVLHASGGEMRTEVRPRRGGWRAALASSDSGSDDRLSPGSKTRLNQPDFGSPVAYARASDDRRTPLRDEYRPATPNDDSDFELAEAILQRGRGSLPRNQAGDTPEQQERDVGVVGA